MKSKIWEYRIRQCTFENGTIKYIVQYRRRGLSFLREWRGQIKEESLKNAQERIKNYVENDAREYGERIKSCKIIDYEI